jgi:hypothetical protein
LNQLKDKNIDLKYVPGMEEISEELEKKQTKKIIKRGYNKKTNQTQLIYDDGTSEIIEGQK